jgi:pimeloyl-ACP methyl ester carboxylesterase
MAAFPIEAVDIAVGDMTLTGRVAGPADGELVVLLHGFPQTSYEWRHQLAALAEAGYRAVAPDQRGYSPGARPDGVEQYATPRLEADVLAVADWFGGHRFHLVAHDWGAIVAWQVAGHYPERLHSLTILSVPHPAAFRRAISDDAEQKEKSGYMLFFQQPDEPERMFLSNDAAGLRAVFTGHDPDAVDDYVRVLTQPGAMTAALNYYRAMNGGLADIGPIDVPTLFIWSTDDVAVARSGAEATAQHVRAPYRFEVLDGVSHWVPDQAPAEVNRLLLDHLSSPPVRA